MPYFKVGDTVHVRTDLVEGEKYFMDDHEKYPGHYFYIDRQMVEDFGGLAVTIGEVRGGFYHIAEDEDCWNWTDEMFTEYVERDMKDFEQPTKAELLSLLGIIGGN